MENNQYKNALNRVRLTDDAKRTLTAALEEAQRAPTASVSPAQRKLSRAAVCLLAACAVLMTLCAAAVFQGTLRGFWGESSAAIYDANHQVLNLSQTVDGWTVTLTDVVCDATHAYIGFIVEPPKGTTLQQTMRWPNPESGEVENRIAEYYFLNTSIHSTTRKEVISSWGARELYQYTHPLASDFEKDPDKLYFAFEIGTMKDFNHDSYDISLSTLYHFGDWDPSIRVRSVSGDRRENGAFAEIMDVPGTFTFKNVRINCPDATHIIEINRPVPLYDGESTLKTIDLSPLSMTLHFQGGAAFGLHDRDTVWKVDGLCSCTHPIILHFTDGTSESLETVNTFQHGKTTVHYTRSGAGTRNDHDAGTLDFVHRFPNLIETDTLDQIQIGDVMIPLK